MEPNGTAPVRTQEHRVFNRVELGTGPVAVEPDISPEYFELERERVFKRCWLCVGRINELTEPGTYVVKDLPVLHTSVLLVRGRDDGVRGFHNMCRHRGNKIVRSGSGAVKHFMCGFHGWTYDVEGRLVSVTDEDEFPGLCKGELGLIPITTDVWEGFAFVKQEPNPRVTLREWIGEVVDQYDGFFNKELRSSYGVELMCGWKPVINAFAESYHAPILHRHSLGTSTSSAHNPFAHPLLLEVFKHHRRFSIFANPQHQPRPAETFGQHHYDANADPNKLPPGVNPGRLREWAFDVLFIFPNWLVMTGSNFYLTLNFMPISWERTAIEMNVYFQQPRTAAEKIAQELQRTLLRDIAREDYNTLEATHSMLKSRVMTHIQLSEQEILLRHLYEVVDEMVRTATG